MSFDLQAIAADLEGLEPGSKLVLLILAARACDECGLSWPGVRHIIRKTGMSERRIQGALSELRSDGHIKAHSHRTGGRGRTTVYVVMPRLEGFSTAPCGKCENNLKTPHSLRGLRNDEPQNPAQPAGYSDKPRRNVRRNPAESAPQSVRESESVSARAREAVASPPTSDPPPRNATEARLAVEAMFSASDGTPPADRPSHAKPGAKNR